jgi:hypothetical protein
VGVGILLVVAALLVPATYAARTPKHPVAHGPCAHIVNTGGGNCVLIIVPLTAQQQAQLAQKQALAQQYAQAQQSATATSSDQQAQGVIASPGGGQTVGNTPINNKLARQSARALNVVQASQLTDYYCGPATAYEILGYQMIHNGLGSTTGPNGETLSQSTLAGATYLETDEYDGTNWSPYVMDPTLNAWLHTSFYAAQPGSGVSGGFSTSTWEADLKTDIDSGWAIAGNVVEYAGGAHLVGHPTNETIYHWIAITGYTGFDTYTTYVDSVHGDTQFWSWAANVPPQSTISSGTMTSLLNGRGYVW